MHYFGLLLLLPDKAKAPSLVCLKVYILPGQIVQVLLTVECVPTCLPVTDCTTDPPKTVRERSYAELERFGPSITASTCTLLRRSYLHLLSGQLGLWRSWLLPTTPWQYPLI